MHQSNNKNTQTVAAFVLLLGMTFAPMLAQADDYASGVPSVTPYRPSVSTPAQLSAPGWLEGEFGGLRIRDTSAERRDSLLYTFKYAFSPDWGLRIGGEAQVRYNDGQGLRLTGGGDTALILKRRFAIDDASAFGLEAGANFATARTGLGTGSGKTDYSLAGIYSADLGDWHTDLNLIGTRFGQVGLGQNRWQSTWAASLSHPISENWGLVGELSGTYQRGAPSTSQFLAGFSYSLSKRTVFDFGAAAGLNRASPNWSAFGGVTVLLGDFR